MKLYYEYKYNNYNKFWEIENIGTKVVIRFGKIGSDGRIKIHNFLSESEANTFMDKIIEQKEKKGYEYSRPPHSVLSTKKSIPVKTKQVKSLKVQKPKVKKCPPGKELNPKTGRCINLKTKTKPKTKSKTNPKTKKVKSLKVKTSTVKKSTTIIRKSQSIVKMPKFKPSGSVLYDVKKNGVMLAFTYKDNQSGKIHSSPKNTNQAPNGWFLSEKFDGYRAIWDGVNFRSRAGNIFEVPTWFKVWMPNDEALDGELFMGRECFEQCGIFRRKVPDDKEWRESNVQYRVFDIPTAGASKGTISKLPFESRMEHLKKIIKRQCSKNSGKCPIIMTEQIKIKDEKELYSRFDKLVKKGAEGVMLRAPGSPYDTKRSSYLLKVKQLFDDECKIIGYKEGSGKYKGLLGAFQCQMVKNPSVKFTISGMDDTIRHNYKKSHPIGTIVTFTYIGLSSKGVPRHPNYLRIRK